MAEQIKQHADEERLPLDQMKKPLCRWHVMAGKMQMVWTCV